jgi:hypothetical protein
MLVRSDPALAEIDEDVDTIGGLSFVPAIFSLVVLEHPAAGNWKYWEADDRRVTRLDLPTTDPHMTAARHAVERRSWAARLRQVSASAGVPESISLSLPFMWPPIIIP